MHEDLYTPINEAREEIKNRQNNEQLKNAVTKYLGELPAPFNNGPRAVLFRNIISPTAEFIFANKQAVTLGIKFLGIEYIEDRFSTRNKDKLALAKLSLLQGIDKNGSPIIRNKRVIDIKTNDNKQFREILTLGNESLHHFHQCLMRNYFDVTPETIDLSDWVKSNGSSAVDYYKKFLAFFVYHGILLETFITNPSEREFTEKVVQPAFQHVVDTLGLKPLIVKSTEEREDMTYWNCYPGGTLI